MSLADFGLENDAQERAAYAAQIVNDVLRRLAVPFTAAYVAEQVAHAWFEIVARQDAADESGVLEVDWDDATNVAVLVSTVLRRYHVKHEVSGRPIVAGDACTMAILRPESAPTRYPALLAMVDAVASDAVLLQRVDGRSRRLTPADAEHVEAYVVFRKSEWSAEPDGAAHRQALRARRAGLALLAACGIAIVLGAAHAAGRNAEAVRLIAPLLAYGVGLTICIRLLLLARGAAQGHPRGLLQRLCGSGGRFDCHAVLSSGASRLFGRLELADVGSVYFATLFAFVAVMLLTNSARSAAPVLFWCVLVPVPYSLYLVAYQVTIRKRICVLCMTVQALLLALAAYVLVMSERMQPLEVHAPAVLLLVAIGAVAIVLLAFASRWLALSAETRRLRVEQDTQRQDPAHLDALATRWRRFPEPDLPGAIVLGRADAPLGLTAVLSLACYPCGQRLKELRRLAHWFGHDIAITILLKPDDLTASLVKPVLQLSVAQEHDAAVALLGEWYETLLAAGASGRGHAIGAAGLNAEFLRRHAAPVPEADTERLYASYALWFARQPVPYTPLLLHQGRVLPQEYWDTQLLMAMFERRRDRLEDAWTDVSQVA